MIDWVEKAKSHIRRGTTDAYDCAASYGMIFDNVKDTWWFVKALAEWLEDST